MRTLLRLAVVCACACVGFAFPTGATAAAASASSCGIPGYSTLWIDYADGSVDFWQSLFARPGIVAAAANPTVSAQLRGAGALSVYWDAYLNNRVGKPDKPADPAAIAERADKLFDAAVAATGCSTPWISENELFGAGLVTPWSATNAQYRANVLAYLQRLAQRGARPFLLVNSTPYTDGAAGDWWRQVAQVADIVREDYFPAPKVWRQGPVAGPRLLRNAFRASLKDFTALGIPKTKLGIMLGFQTGAGKGGREGLERSAWLETIKWQGLAAREVAQDTGVATIWSWGWAHYGTSPPDPDKEAAACVYLWTRSPALCDAPADAGAGFDASRAEGLIRLPRGVVCSFPGNRRITQSDLLALQRLTGDRELAYTALLQRVAELPYAAAGPTEVLAAEQSVVASRFGGSRSAYLAEIARARATLPIARAAIADQLQRAKIETKLSAPPPSVSAIGTFYQSYPDLLARAVQATPAPWWLGGRTNGVALSQLAPGRLFELSTGGKARVTSVSGSYSVKATGDALPLGALPLQQARPAIAAALTAFARDEGFEQWSVAHQSSALGGATCLGDDLPQPGAVDLASFMPFLSLAG